MAFSFSSLGLLPGVHYLMLFSGEPKPLGSITTPLEVAQRELHLTLLGNFRLPEAFAAEWFSTVAKLLTEATLPPVTTGRQAIFGAQMPISVALLEEPQQAPYRAFHERLYEEVHAIGGDVLDPYSGKAWTPHISFAPTGQELEFTHATLIHHRGGLGHELVRVANFSLS